MPSHSSDPSSSDLTAVAPPAPAAELTAAMPVLPGTAATGNGSDVTTMTAACDYPATDAGDMTGHGPRLSGTYVYGYDSAGNPTLTDAGYFSDRTPPH